MLMKYVVDNLRFRKGCSVPYPANAELTTFNLLKFSIIIPVYNVAPYFTRGFLDFRSTFFEF